MTEQPSESVFESLAAAAAPDDLLDRAEQALRESGDFHHLFDVLLLRARQQSGLPFRSPTSLENVPKDSQDEFRGAYIAAARQVGELFLAADRIADAWAYFRTINETEPIRLALDKKPLPREPGDESDELLQLMLYDGAHPVRGLELMLQTHGICNTVTSMSQLMPQLSTADRRTAARMMVRTIHADLLQSVKRHVETRMPVLTAKPSLCDLIQGKPWLFEEGNYHTDVSHLHSIVGFARSLESEDPELPLALELCDYGEQLADHLRYPGDVPFEDFYPANRRYLQAVAGTELDKAIEYFQQRMEDETEPPRKKAAAFVLLDLAARIRRLPEILPMAGEWLSGPEDATGFSFADACLDAGHPDILADISRRKKELIPYLQARLESLSKEND